MAKRFLKTKIGLAVIVLLAASLIGARIYLPYWVKDYVNVQINNLKGYGGGIEDIDISLWRGAYTIHGLNIYKTGAKLPEPFVAAKAIDLSIEWRALLHGAIVAEIDIYNINLNFLRAQTGEGANWPDLVDKLSPFDINRLSVHGGRISYLDHNAKPEVNVYLDVTQAEVTNLRNVEDKNMSLPSRLQVTGKSVGGGKLNVSGNLNIMRDIPDFDVDTKLEQSSLPAFNDYAQKFAGIDFEKGTIGFYSELAAAKGQVAGYLKVLATDISFINLEKDNDDVIDVVWESLVSVFVELFENQRTDQFALRIPIEGNLDNPEQDGWSTFISIFQNAFGRAFARDTDGTVSFKDLLEHGNSDKPQREEQTQERPPPHPLSKNSR